MNSPPILVYFSGDWDVHWGYGVLTHGHISWRNLASISAGAESLEPGPLGAEPASLLDAHRHDGALCVDTGLLGS